MILLGSQGNLFAQLRADFSMDKPGGCSPVAISFLNKTTGASAGAIYHWDFGNGNDSYLYDGGAVYSTEQTYSVTLTVTDGQNTSVKTSQVTVYKPPVIDFNASVAKGCLPLPVTFTAATDPGSGSVSAYTWDFGDGNTATGYTNSQSHVYNVIQNPIVSLTVTNNYGCHTTLQKSGLVTVLRSLNPIISADKNFLCLITDPVQFTNSSTGPGTLSYLWDFGDGNSSVQKNPQYVFNKKGIYTVKLQVTSSEGCVASGTLSNNLNVASFTTDFTVPTPLCVSGGYDIVNNSNPQPDNSTWYVDGIQTSIWSYFYFNSYAPGPHTISLTNNFGACPQTTTKNIVVNDLPSPSGFSYAEQGKCGPPETIVFTDLSNATKHEWDFNYNNYQINVGSTLKQPSFTANGNSFTVYLRSTNDAGCSIYSTKSIYLFTPYVGIYTDGGTQSTCGTPNTQTFHTTGPPLSSWVWHFGDGTTSTEASPTHVYTKVGAFTAYLTYTTQDGCTGNVSNYTAFYVSPPLQVDFTASSTKVCGNTPVTFNVSSNDPNLIWTNWDFGDGSSDYHSGHTYSQPGTYTISLTASSPGCTSNITKTSYITVAPLFFTMNSSTNTCDGDRGIVSFSENISGADRLIWNFGDGTNETTAGNLTDYKHHYTKSGSFSLTVTAVNDQYNCSITRGLQSTVLLKQSPKLTADKTVVCTSDILHVVLKNNLDAGSIYLYSNFGMRFEYGDGTAFSGNIQPPYSSWGNEYDGALSLFEKGKKDLRMITTSSFFYCSDTSNFIPLTIKGIKPGFEVVQANQCFESPVIVRDTSWVDPGNHIVSWTWNFSDGSVVNQSGTVSHVYSNPGNYPVRLTVRDAAGCSATSVDNATSYVSVNGPKAAFTTSGNDVHLNTTVYFYNATNSYGSYNTVYNWDFGDGNGSTDYYPSHTYPVPGNYTVTLISTDPVTGCHSSASQEIHVAIFNSAFSFTKSYVSGSCPPVLVNFTNTSVNYTSVKWDFGDGVTADNLNQTSHIYKNPGKYITTLTVFAQNGLQEQFIDSVFVKVPSASMAANPLEGCIGTIVHDTAISLNANSYVWDFGDGTVISSPLPSATHIYNNSGLYKPRLLVKDMNGCIAGTDLPGEINIHPNPVVTVTPSEPILCKGSSLSLQADGGLTYHWTPNIGLSNDAIAAPVASPNLTTTYHLDIADDLGCRNTASVTITVIAPGNLQTGNDTTICEGNPVQLKASGEMLYNWIGNTEGLSDPGINNPVARPSTTTTYTVTGTDAYSCFPDTTDITVHVLPLPLVYAGADTTVEAGASFIIQGSGGSDIVQWNWEPAKYLSCSDCASPLCTPRGNVLYTLEVKSENGCTSSDQLVVKLECDEAKVSIPNAFTPNGDHVNDLFVVRGIAIVKHMAIYDRWGTRVFERSNFSPADPISCWDGNQNGMPALTGTYVYFVEMECPTGGAFSRKGTVTLIR